MGWVGWLVGWLVCCGCLVIFSVCFSKEIGKKTCVFFPFLLGGVLDPTTLFPRYESQPVLFLSGANRQERA